MGQQIVVSGDWTAEYDQVPSGLAIVLPPPRDSVGRRAEHTADSSPYRAVTTTYPMPLVTTVAAAANRRIFAAFRRSARTASLVSTLPRTARPREVVAGQRTEGDTEPQSSKRADVPAENAVMSPTATGWGPPPTATASARPTATETKQWPTVGGRDAGSLRCYTPRAILSIGHDRGYTEKIR